MNSEVDVVVIGAGIVGCAIAHELSCQRVRVALVEREADVGFGTSKANSGIIHAGHHGDSGTLKGELEWAGNQRWERLADRLAISFDRVGDLTVAFDEAELATLHELRDRAAERGIPGVEMWDRSMLREREPALATELIGAVHAPTAAVVNPYEACFALAGDAVANGATIHVSAPVTAIEVGGEGFEITAGAQPIRARFVVNAAGFGAPGIERLVGLDAIELIARKGEEYLLDKRLRGLVHRIVFPCPTPTSKGILVIPTHDGTLMVGPTAHDVDDPADTTTTMAGADEVFSTVRRLVPGITRRDCIAEFAGVRAVSTTGDFVVENTVVPGFVDVAGIQSPGLTAAPAIADVVADLLAEQGLGLEPASDTSTWQPPTIPVRELTHDQRAARAADDPGFGRVVCRCELVTDAEIRDAIRRGGTTLDGIKFRTRAGMGRCQGGFCTWRVMQLMADELDVAITAITKRGGDSWVVVERSDPASPVGAEGVSR